MSRHGGGDAAWLCSTPAFVGRRGGAMPDTGCSKGRLGDDAPGRAR